MSPLEIGADPGVANAQAGQPKRLVYVWQTNTEDPRDTFLVVTVENDIAEAVRIASEVAAETAKVVSVRLVEPALAEAVGSDAER